MEELLGEHNSDRAFDRFLGRWRVTMRLRIEQATAGIGGIPGVAGLILAGSNGTGHPWPLSDIDLIPIYADGDTAGASARVEQGRLALLQAWSSQGWRTGLDVGRLWFTTGEVDAAFASGDPDPGTLLADDRWYHAIDKAYGGRALIDPDGRASRFMAWLTDNRFHPGVVAMRMERSAVQARVSLEAASAALTAPNRAHAFAALLKSIQWYQVHLMERWGERDNSLGRFGTRFERAARARGMGNLCDELNDLASLSRELVDERMKHAPRWVHERRDRSWQARRQVSESVTELQNDLDVLRVCTMYELRLVSEPPYGPWLAIPSEDELRDRTQAMMSLVQRIRIG